MSEEALLPTLPLPYLLGPMAGFLPSTCDSSITGLRRISTFSVDEPDPLEQLIKDGGINVDMIAKMIKSELR